MKRIILARVDRIDPVCWKADSTRYGVSAYGRTVAEARQRLFHTVCVERGNAAMAGVVVEKRFDRRVGV